jgi:hypothetical protein
VTTICDQGVLEEVEIQNVIVGHDVWATESGRAGAKVTVVAAVRVEFHASFGVLVGR